MIETKSTSRRVFEVCNGILLLLLAAVTIIPFIYVVSTSLTSEQEFIQRGLSLIPRRITLESYEFIFKPGNSIFRAYKNTLFVTLVGTSLNMVLTCMLAYGMSKKWMPGRNIIMFFIFFTMLFNGGMIPGYLVVKSFGLLNSLWSLIIPGAINTWNMILLRNFFSEIPDSVEESAKIDGANDIGVLFRIVLPMSLPALATITLFYAVEHWNAWMGALIYLSDKKLWPVQLLLRQIILLSSVSDLEVVDNSITPPSYAVQMATLVVATTPILCAYPFIQKYFVKGVMVGSVKG